MRNEFDADKTTLMTANTELANKNRKLEDLLKASKDTSSTSLSSTQEVKVKKPNQRRNLSSVVQRYPAMQTSKVERDRALRQSLMSYLDSLNTESGRSAKRYTLTFNPSQSILARQSRPQQTLLVLPSNLLASIQQPEPSMAPRMLIPGQISTSSSHRGYGKGHFGDGMRTGIMPRAFLNAQDLLSGRHTGPTHTEGGDFSHGDAYGHWHRVTSAKGGFASSYSMMSNGTGPLAMAH
jgi:hypothetical protein